MKILIDIVHPADVNFYRNSVLELRKEHEVVISVMDRGNLPAFVEKCPSEPQVKTIIGNKEST